MNLKGFTLAQAPSVSAGIWDLARSVTVAAQPVADCVDRRFRAATVRERLATIVSHVLSAGNQDESPMGLETRNVNNAGPRAAAFAKPSNQVSNFVCVSSTHSLNLPEIHELGAWNGACMHTLGRRYEMLNYAVIFLIIAILAAIFGFTGVYVPAAGIAK